MYLCQMELFILSKQSEKDMVAKPSKTTTREKKRQINRNYAYTAHYLDDYRALPSIQTFEHIFTPTQNVY